MARCASRGLKPGILILLALGLAPSGCKIETSRQAKVGGVWLPQADGSQKAPSGVNLPLSGGLLPEELPDGSPLRLAIAREVIWKDVAGMLKQLERAERDYVLLVGSGRKVRAFHLSDALQGENLIRLFATAEGKVCVAPPGTREYKCVERADRKHVDRAFVRQLVREAVQEYDLHDAELEVPPELGWADVVRALDGVRTCCKDVEVRVRLKQ